MYQPEVRLWAVAVASPLMIGGLILLGFALGNHMSWVAVAFGWGIYVFGTVWSTTLLPCGPEGLTYVYS